MLRTEAEKVINSFLNEYYSFTRNVSVGIRDLTDNNKAVFISVDECYLGFGDKLRNINIAQKDIQSFSKDNDSINSFHQSCKDIVNKYIEDRQYKRTTTFDATFNDLFFTGRQSGKHFFFGIDPAHSFKKDNNLLDAADPYFDLLKKSNREGRNNQLILSSIQLELLAAQAGCDHFSKDDLIAALEQIAADYTEKAESSRTENS